MESKEKIKIMLGIACLAAFSVFAATHYRRRRPKPSNNKKDSTPCCSDDLHKKPQNAFKRVLANNSYTPFKHLKPEGAVEDNSLNLHPYEDAIAFLLDHPPIAQNFTIGNENSNMGGAYIWVNTESQLEVLADVLSKKKVFAVDTEQHSLRSFLGFTALMQISTQEEDYLLDTIALHDGMSILRPVFANPSICKVLHGADNDVLWLQRDFHIYVVNLFDTAKACEVLSKPHKSLAYLLETYCGIATNKLLQREDWRQRPLSAEMIQYARDDARYLLYIADCLTSELKALNIENSACPDNKFSFVLEASRRSNTVCLQLYAKDIEASPGDSAAASIFSRYLNGQGGKYCETKELVRKLCTWRDLMGRVHDESLRYILSDQAIVALATEVPKSATTIYNTILQADLNVDLSIIGPSIPSPSPVVCSHLEDICYLLRDDTGHSDDVFNRILQEHLGPTGSCSLSVYNYAMLFNASFKSTNTFYSKENGGRPTKKFVRKASRELFVQKFSCKSPVYHNCRIYASDGRLLCYCDRRKIEWYLQRNLAKIVDNNPLAIMLLFEPKGRPEDEDNDFYIQSKKNMCVGCGEKNHYLRYRVIPSCYRVIFPEHLKSHRSHDIVLLCVDCHEIAHAAAEKAKKQIAEEFKIPLFIRKVVDSGEAGKNQVIIGACGPAENLEESGVSPLQLRTAAMALLRHGSRMPSKRHQELTLIVRSYFGGREICEKDLETALMVGMSPHKRRRFEKKRGLSSKDKEGNIHSEKSHDNNSDTKRISQKENGSHLDTNNDDDQNREPLDENGLTNTSTYSDVQIDSLINGEPSVTSVGEQNFDYRRISEKENGFDLDTNNVDYENRELLDEKGLDLNTNNGDCENRETLDENGKSYCPSMPHGTVPPKCTQKLSLLGHGPHGKQVVENLLKEYGEDGILQFCQRWRQVFVEAVHPRFLPAGWDIRHSGRRDFGEHSVYNPSKNHQMQ